MEGRQSERNVVYNTQNERNGGKKRGSNTTSEIYFGEHYCKVSFNFISLVLNGFTLTGVLSLLLVHLLNEMLNLIHSFRFCCQYVSLHIYIYLQHTHKILGTPVSENIRHCFVLEAEKYNYKTYVHSEGKISMSSPKDTCNTDHKTYLSEQETGFIVSNQTDVLVF